LIFDRRLFETYHDRQRGDCVCDQRHSRSAHRQHLGAECRLVCTLDAEHRERAGERVQRRRADRAAEANSSRDGRMIGDQRARVVVITCLEPVRCVLAEQGDVCGM
jgi:hypothetical protein